MYFFVHLLLQLICPDVPIFFIMLSVDFLVYCWVNLIVHLFKSNQITLEIRKLKNENLAPDS